MAEIDFESFDPKELHKQIMGKVWSLYCGASVESMWIEMPSNVQED